jgi:hypothetical protein
MVLMGDTKMKINGVELHEDVTEDMVCGIAEENMFGMTSDGICVACGNVQGGCEPDAVGYTCEDCGRGTVYGAEELMIHMVM